ncbi:hypothetical protein [Aeoliella sp.]|uniref:hypothetical protein n=1 Tax=Aeoliella sp. TaxID=2795800 RepID=UPI003CCBB268
MAKILKNFPETEVFGKGIVDHVLSENESVCTMNDDERVIASGNPVSKCIAFCDPIWHGSSLVAQQALPRFKVESFDIAAVWLMARIIFD